MSTLTDWMMLEGRARFARAKASSDRLRYDWALERWVVAAEAAARGRGSWQELHGRGLVRDRMHELAVESQAAADALEAESAAMVLVLLDGAAARLDDPGYVNGVVAEAIAARERRDAMVAELRDIFGGES